MKKFILAINFLFVVSTSLFSLELIVNGSKSLAESLKVENAIQVNKYKLILE